MRRRGVAAALLALALGGCAALPWPSGPARTREGPRSGAWLDLRGAVHVHTRASHDSAGGIGALIDAAHLGGISWIALTEHVRNPRHAPPRGTIEGVILIPGWEFSAAGGSILALGLEDAAGLPRAPAARVAAIRARGGLAFIGHLERSALGAPERFAELGADGIELVNLHANAERVRWRLALAELLLPARFALRRLLLPPHENLARWARLPGARTVVGGADAHEKFRVLGHRGGTVDRYRDVLRLLTTHVHAREASAEAILEALRAGRSYVAFEGLAAVDRLGLRVEPGGVHVELPRSAALALVCAGERVAEAEAQSALLRAGRDLSVCHVEAWLGRRLWIATSRLGSAW